MAPDRADPLLALFSRLFTPPQVPLIRPPSQRKLLCARMSPDGHAIKLTLDLLSGAFWLFDSPAGILGVDDA